MYTDLAPWFHLLTHPSDYEDEAAFVSRVVDDVGDGQSRTLLELGSGGGNNASHLKARFECTLTDISPEMLALSRTLNPECEHLEGDMRSVRLERTFDAVFVHDAIAYITIEDDLRAAIVTAAEHCRRGGAVLLVPDFVAEAFVEGTDHGGSDGPDRALRYLQWYWDPDPADTTHVADFAYLLRLPDGTVDVRRDRHLCGLFSRKTWLALLEGAGVDAERVSLHQADDDPFGREAFIGRRR
jgi:SAM-dependent methyltransferase